jgi:hypothetical protein
MDLIESPLCRLQSNVSRFFLPSATMRNVHALKVQIELRRRALKDIEAIRRRLRPFMRCRCRLRPFMRCENKRPHRRLYSRRVGRSRLPVGHFAP